MNILYIIGNGFDIEHGYDTSYSAFYTYLMNNKEKYPNILDICEEINSNTKDWSDFEYGFGEYIKKHGNEHSISEYKIKIVESSNALVDFLKYTIRDLSDKFFDGSTIYDNVYKPFKNCEEEDNKTLTSLFDSQSKNVSVICLNYTEICKMYFNSVDVVDVINLHGRIGYNPIIGVDNLSQLKSDKLTEECSDKLSNLFAKNKLVKRALKSTNNDFKNRLKESNVIVIYGTSMGITDETLWKMIGERVTEGASLIYCSYGDYVGTNNVVEHMDFIDEKKKWLCQILQIDENINGDNIFIADSKLFFKSKFQKPKAIRVN